MNSYMLLPTWRRWAALLLGALAIALPLMLLTAAHAAAQAVEPSVEPGVEPGVEPAGAYRAEVNALLAADLAAAAQEGTGPVSFLVVLRDQPDPAALAASRGLQGAAVADRRAALYAALTAQAAAAQAPLRAWLDARGVAYTPHYLVNMLEVQGDAALAEELRLMPEVDRLARNPAVSGLESKGAGGSFGAGGGQTRLQPVAVWRRAVDAWAWGYPAGGAARPGWWVLPAAGVASGAEDALGTGAAALPYGLTYTKADQVWALGFRGAGVVIGSQDTGVQWDHPALKAAYRGWDAQAQTATHAYNWFDAWGRDSAAIAAGCSADAQVPCDDGTHGTHTVGTLVGDATGDGGTILGMAPEAKWIGCRNMRGGVGTPGSYITCFEWLLAPYPQGGDPFTDGNPQLAADVINNSWGCPPSEGCDAESLRQIVDTMRAAGILVVASAGNEGGGGLGASVCSSVQNPIAIYDSVLSVGAHGQNGQIAYFSSRGPVIVDGSGRRKPDIAAPGVAVFSTRPTARGRYGFESGTSMASPHVAGAVALLWSALPELKGDIDRTEELLLRAATPVLDNNCDPDGPPQAPNNVYGAGRLDVLAAIEMMQGVTLTIKVDLPWVAETSGKTWRLVELRTGAARTAIGGSDGTVTWGGAGQAALLSGTYVVLRPGCVDYVAADVVTLAPGETVTRDVSLAGAVCLALPDIGK